MSRETHKLYCASCGEQVEYFVMLSEGDEIKHCSVCGLILHSEALAAQVEDKLKTLQHVVAAEDHTEMVKILLESGAKVNAKNGSGWTPLHVAAYMGHAESVKLLLEGEVNAKDKDGETPLHRAAWPGHTNIAKLLIKAGANVNAKDKDGKTPLDKTWDREFWIDPKEQAKCADLLRTHGAKTGAELDAEAKQGKQE